MLVPDASFAAKETALRTLVRQHGEPRIVSADNLPSGVEGYRRVMPTSQATTDLKHLQTRIKNTGNAYALAALSPLPALGAPPELVPYLSHLICPSHCRYSPCHAAQVEKLAGMFLVLRQQGEHSIEEVEAKLRSG